MHTVLRLAFLGLLLCGPLPAAESWTKMKLGMSAEQTVTLLGDPVLRSRGRGFETWTYDNGAEVLLHGTVVGWTAPVTAGLAKRSQDVWINRPAGRHYATLHAALADPARAPAAPTPARRKTPPTGAGIGFEEYIRG